MRATDHVLNSSTTQKFLKVNDTFITFFIVLIMIMKRRASFDEEQTSRTQTKLGTSTPGVGGRGMGFSTLIKNRNGFGSSDIFSFWPTMSWKTFSSSFEHDQMMASPSWCYPDLSLVGICVSNNHPWSNWCASEWAAESSRHSMARSILIPISPCRYPRIDFWPDIYQLIYQESNHCVSTGHMQPIHTACNHERYLFSRISSPLAIVFGAECESLGEEHRWVSRSILSWKTALTS